MLQLALELDFPEKPLCMGRSQKLLFEDLYCHVPIVPMIPGKIDDRHPTPADLPLDGVVVPEGFLDLS